MARLPRRTHPPMTARKQAPKGKGNPSKVLAKRPPGTQPGDQQIAPLPPAPRPFPQAVHYRYLEAIVEALQADGNTSNRAIAKRMNVRHETITRWTRRHPQLRGWVGQQLQERTRGRHEQLIGRVFEMGMRGSIEHAKLYFQVTGSMGSDAGATVEMNQFNGPTIIKMGVPGPGDPPLACSPVTRPLKAAQPG